MREKQNIFYTGISMVLQCVHIGPINILIWPVINSADLSKNLKDDPILKTKCNKKFLKLYT